MRGNIWGNSETEETPRISSAASRFPAFRLGSERLADASARDPPILRHQRCEVGRGRQSPSRANQTARAIERAGFKLEREKPVAIETARHPQVACRRRG